MNSVFLPGNMPAEIVSKLFNVLAFKRQSKKLTYEDFLCLYYLLTSAPQEEVARWYFYVFAPEGDPPITEFLAE